MRMRAVMPMMVPGTSSCFHIGTLLVPPLSAVSSSLLAEAALPGRDGMMEIEMTAMNAHAIARAQYAQVQCTSCARRLDMTAPITNPTGALAPNNAKAIFFL